MTTAKLSISRLRYEHQVSTQKLRAEINKVVQRYVIEGVTELVPAYEGPEYLLLHRSSVGNRWRAPNHFLLKVRYMPSLEHAIFQVHLSHTWSQRRAEAPAVGFSQEQYGFSSFRVDMER